jgi:hypothetical protein
LFENPAFAGAGGMNVQHRSSKLILVFKVGTTTSSQRSLWSAEIPDDDGDDDVAAVRFAE